MSALAIPVLTADELLAILWRRRLVALAVGGAVTALALLALLSIRPVYEAQASLDLKVGRRPVQFGYEAGFDAPAQQFSQLNTQREILLSNEVLHRAVEASGLLQTKAYQSAPVPAAVLRDRLKVTTNRDSWALIVALRDEDPQRAEHALRILLDVFLAFQVERQKASAEAALAFLAQEVDQAAQRVEEAEVEERRFAAERKLIADNPDIGFIGGRLIRMNDQRIDLQRDLASIAPLARAIEEARLQPEPERRREALLRIDRIARTEMVARQKQEIFDLETKRSALAQRYLERHPRMIEINEQIAAKRIQLDDAIAQTAEGLLTDHRRLADEVAAYEPRIAAEEQRMITYREDLLSLKRLRETSETARKLHRSLADRLSQERVTARLEHPSVAVIDPPAAEAKPVNIKRGLFAAIALALGLAAALSTPVVLELADRRVRNGAEAAAIAGAPLLAQLPCLDDAPPAAPGGDDPPALLEAVRALRTRLQLQPSAQHGLGRVLLIASAQGGDGRTMLASRLAWAFAASGRPALAVDGDLRRPGLGEALGAASGPGLCRLLAGDPDIAADTTAPHLAVMPAGEAPANPAELLNSHCLAEWLDHCRAAHDVVVVDSSPLAEVADALLIGAAADGIVLLARAGHTERAALRAAVDRLAAVRHKILGVVWNDDPAPVPTAMPQAEAV